jgi:hypothetical protein
MAGTTDGMFDAIIEECYAWPVVGPEALGPAAGKFRSVLTDEAAVAAAVTGNIAVLGPSGEEIPIWMTNAEVKAYTTKQGHATTNEAMKYVRDHVGEKNVPGVPTLRAVEVTHAHLGGGLSIPTMTKPLKTGSDEGMDYWFDLGKVRTVDVKAMVANLPREKRDEMLGNNHVCRMTLEYVPESYDRKRRDMAIRCKRWKPFPIDVPVYVWDWHILLSDGSVWRFHTDWSKKKASVVKVQIGDVLPPVPDEGINESDGPGSYNRYKYGNYQSTQAMDVADAKSAVAESESAVAEAGTAASSSNAVGSPTIAPTEMDSPTESNTTTASLASTVDLRGDTPRPEIPASAYMRRTRPQETCHYRNNAPRRDTSGGGHHSDSSASWTDTDMLEWAEAVRNAVLTHGNGATAIMQPPDTHVHAEISKAYKELVGEQQSGESDTAARKAVSFSDMSTIHYPFAESSVPASSQSKAPPPPLPYSGSDVRKLAAENSVVTDRADKDRWEWGSRVPWWQSDDEWSRR